MFRISPFPSTAYSYQKQIFAISDSKFCAQAARRKKQIKLPSTRLGQETDLCKFCSILAALFFCPGKVTQKNELIFTLDNCAKKLKCYYC